MIDVYLLTTGGTIDGADSDKDTLRETSDAAKWLRAQKDVKIIEVKICNKDSRLIDEHDRASLITEIENAGKLILGTHGTFTIAETGRELKKHFAETDKTFLLIGAWVPFGEDGSDAPAQMEFALETLKNNPPKGVWIAMDGKLWDPDITQKVETAPGKFALVELAETTRGTNAANRQTPRLG